MKDIAEKSLFDIPGSWKTLLWILVILGIGMFIAGLMTGGEESVVRTWQAFLINTVFWGGIAHAGVIFAVIWQMTDANGEELSSAWQKLVRVFYRFHFLCSWLSFSAVMCFTNGPILLFFIMVKQSSRAGSICLSS